MKRTRRRCSRRSVSPSPRRRSRSRRGRANETPALLWPPQSGRGRRPAARSPGPRGGRAAGADRDRRVLRLHQAPPVQTRLPSEGAVRDRGQHPAEVAGANRRRHDRPGHDDPARRQHGPREHGNRIARAADPQRRDGEGSPAPVPGRQLVRRTAARQAVGEDGLIRLHDPDHADFGSGAARPGARRAQHRYARQPAELPDQLRRSADGLPDPCGGRRTGTRSAWGERGAGAQQSLRARCGTAARRRDRRPGDHGHRTE